MQTAAGGGGDVGGGLSRFRSAPATWLDALLDDDLTPEDSLRIGNNNSGGLTQLLAAGTAPSAASPDLARSNSSTAYNLSVAAADAAYFDACGGVGGGSGPADPYASSSLGGGFARMNSSPAEFLGGNVDSYFSSYGPGFPSNYLGGSPQMEISSPSGKRVRDKHVDLSSPSKLSTTQMKVERSTETGSLMDLEMEKLFEDSVPCRVRAKRGCATHPRSIAERVRRTRISDRIRRLQELVPNMDKQTNTADMLEEAVEYVKRLQQQIEELTEDQKRCTCSARN